MSQRQSKILSIEQVFHHFIMWSLFIITGVMTLVILLGVFFRYILEAPLPWSEELARYLMIWGVCCGVPIAFREGSHIAVSILVDKLHGPSGKIILRISQIIIFIFVAIVMVEGFILAFKVSSQTSPAMEISMKWPYLSIPIGCLFILFEMFIMMFFDRRPLREGKEESL